MTDTKETAAEEHNSIDEGARPDFAVVGIGASAGGLEALERFFSNCPEDTGAGFVVIQHLSPDHKSMMLDLLGRYTKMSVAVVEDGMKIEKNKVFLIPAGKIMRLNGDSFELTPKAPNTLTLPIDIFFSSLAQHLGRLAVGIVLSGTGSDGSRGALAINAAGGFLMAQEMKSAKFDGMPGSIISTGLVDAVLPAEELPARLISHMSNVPLEPMIQVPEDHDVPVSDDEAYEGIVQLLFNNSGIDFNDYKLATILRRIERRMQVRHLTSIREYYELLQDDLSEIETLKREMLIPVTSFFRDQEAFTKLEEEVIENIVKESDYTTNIRVWVAGTSTGEEAYTIAMLFVEAFERERRWPNLKIFATDVSQESIDVASNGSYPESAAAELTEERIERFFKKAGSSYQVKPELRQLIVFAKHNLLSDPPFTQMDLVTCRNTLIYFRSDAQKKAIRRLQFAVQPTGYLFLGTSESLSTGEFNFSPLDSKQKIFKRTGLGKPAPFEADGQGFSNFQTKRIKSRPHLGRRYASDETLRIDKAISTLLDSYTPPSMLVNEHNEIIHLFGKIQPFFEAREGTASLDVTKLLPERMVPVASALMFKAAKEKRHIVSDAVRLDLGDNLQQVIKLSVRPVNVDSKSPLLLLSFENIEQAPESQDSPTPVDIGAETVKRIEILETELSATRESLQATIEELETSNEELQATNEELMASNEELQSSNEELQSVNEELNTVNSEYQEKVNILNRVNADLDSMAKAVGVATVFVDQQLNLTRYSPDAVGIFKLRSSDVGRPLDDISNVLRYPELMNDLTRTMDTERMIQKQVNTTTHELYLVRILPYRISSDRSGAVATFIDITAFRDKQRMQAILDALPEHIAVLEPNGNIALVNQAWERFAKANGDSQLTKSGLGNNYLEVCTEEDSEPDEYAKRAYHGIKAVLEGSTSQYSMKYPCHSPTEQRWFVLSVAPIQGFEYGAVVSHINISNWYTESEEN